MVTTRRMHLPFSIRTWVLWRHREVRDSPSAWHLSHASFHYLIAFQLFLDLRPFFSRSCLDRSFRFPFRPSAMAPLRVFELDHASSASPADSKAQVWRKVEEEDDNMLVKLQREVSRKAFFDHLERQVSDIGGIVSQHLSLSSSQRCDISDRSEWLYGGFNVCIPITVTNWRKQRLVLRCPLPYMADGPAGLEEKIRCEAATFFWISQNCPRVPIPHLWGFGLPDSSGVSITTGCEHFG